jgi:SAM-dependent methyltransferase
MPKELEAAGRNMEYRNYFEFRQVTPGIYEGFKLPPYLERVITAIPNGRVLDFGCGFGQMLSALKLAGVTNAEGLDIAPEAIEYCRAHGLRCTDGNADPDFYKDHRGYFDFVVMSHVLEHFPKEQTIVQLKRVKDILKPGGGLMVMVPNAQSNTGAYWAYEDITHYQLFTSGSLYHVLRAAGFDSIEFLDVDCTDGLPVQRKIIKRFFLRLYAMNFRFWNRVTSSAFHAPSTPIFSFEIKALARASQ